MAEGDRGLRAAVAVRGTGGVDGAAGGVDGAAGAARENKQRQGEQRQGEKRQGEQRQGEQRQGEQRRRLVAAIRRTDLPLERLWLRYFSLGGTADLAAVQGYLDGALPLPPGERDVLAEAVNERLDELAWRPRVPYSRPLPEVRPQHGPLAALLDLLDGAHGAPPDRLPELVARAGRALDVDATLYLVDHAQRVLVPAAGPDPQSETGCDVEPLGIDTTLPGRAFRDVRPMAADSDDKPRWWVPVLDGDERVGVLEARVGAPSRLDDRWLLDQLVWLGWMVGHLAVLSSRYGDAVDAVRRHHHRTPSAELIWSLLPPLAAAAGGIAVAGLVEPVEAAGSDAFDYALSDRSVQLALFDGTGSSMQGALRTATALAAYRSARRNGYGLYDQARSVDESLRGQRGATPVSGVLADVDLASGRLRYLCAQHPHPLLLRGGRMGKELGGGTRPPFGRGDVAMTIAQEALHPGDWLVLYTDGVVDARDAAGRPFGLARLVDLLEREVAAGHEPAETLRRVTRAVLEHQDGAMRDDATVLLARWEVGGLR